MLHQGRSLAVFQMSSAVMKSLGSPASTASSRPSRMALPSWPAEVGCSHLCLPWPPWPTGSKGMMTWNSWTVGLLTDQWTFWSFCKSWTVWSPLVYWASFTSLMCTLDSLASQLGEGMELWQKAGEAHLTSPVVETKFCGCYSASTTARRRGREEEGLWSFTWWRQKETTYDAKVNAQVALHRIPDRTRHVECSNNLLNWMVCVGSGWKQLLQNQGSWAKGRKMEHFWQTDTINRTGAALLRERE